MLRRLGLKGNNLTRENIRISKDFEEVEAKHDKLLSRQKEMVEKTFTRTIMEVWSVDPVLMVPQVEKRVDKSASLSRQGI